jgi:hypothetical protein
MSRMSKGEMARRARAEGRVHFTAACAVHGRTLHYAATRRCVRCTAEAKDPVAQAAYWAANKMEINARRRSQR